MLETIKKLGKVLNKKQRSRVAILAVMIVIGGLLETFSVSLIFPLVTAITEENAFTENGLVVFISDLFKCIRSCVFCYDNKVYFFTLNSPNYKLFSCNHSTGA